MAKKRKDEDEPGVPAWMVTYGDMMTLLLTFFVLLLSFSSIQESKFHEAIGSLQAAMGVMNTSQYVLETQAPPLPTDVSRARQQLRAQMKKIEDYLKSAGLDGNVEVLPTWEGFVIRLDNPLLFDTGSADLKPEANGIMDAIISLLSQMDYELRIEGHTDNVPIHNQRFPSNWELSTTRALSVLKAVNRRGIDPTRLSASGYGEFKPLVPNDSDENRQRNRRVEIHVKTDLVGNSRDKPWFLEED